MRTKTLITAFIFLSLCLLAVPVWAGPPFFTDDPEPVEHLRWEICLATQWAHEESGTSATLPHAEVNFGVLPDTQLHLIMPAAYSNPRDASAQYGLGDLELGIKYRFIHEDEKGWRPQVGIFPIVDLPTGDSSRGLGEERARIFFPVWLQKSWGPWTTYGGGGYWYHPGEDKQELLVCRVALAA